MAGQRLDWVALGLLVAGIVMLVLGLPRLMPACFNRLERGLPAVIGARGFLAGAFVGAEAFVPLMMVEERKVALVLAGAALTVGSIGWTTGSWLQSRPWLKIRRDRLITLGCVSLTIGLGRHRAGRADPCHPVLGRRRSPGSSPAWAWASPPRAPRWP